MAAVMPPGQQRKDERFPCLRRQSNLIAGPDGQSPAATLEFAHQNWIAAAAAGHQQLQKVDASVRPQSVKILSHHRRGEAGEGGHRIDCRDCPQLVKTTPEILLAEAFPPR